MKKIIFMIMAFTLLVPCVGAKTYYGPNEMISDYQETLMESERGIVEKTPFYRFYRWEKKYGDFLKKSEMNGELYDTNNLKYGIWSDWSQDDVPDDTDVETRTVYEIKKNAKIRYFFLSVYNSTGKNLEITELSFYTNGEKIAASYSCNTCTSEYEKIIQNGIASETPFEMNDSEVLKVDLNGEYEIRDLTLKYGIYGDGTVARTIHLIYNNDENYKVPYYRTTVAGSFYAEGYDSIPLYTYNYNFFLKSNSKYDTFISEEQENGVSVKEIEQSRWRDIYYSTYTLEKEYMDGYHSEGTREYPNKDLESEKFFYRTREPEQISFFENVILYKNESLEEKLIEYANVDYKIIDTIDYSKSGIYEVEVITEFSKTKHQIEFKLEEEKDIWSQNKNEKLSNLSFSLPKEVESLKNEKKKQKENIKNLEIINQKEASCELQEELLKTYEKKVEKLQGKIRMEEQKIRLLWILVLLFIFLLFIIKFQKNKSSFVETQQKEQKKC